MTKKTIPFTEEFTIESLWDDYERRTWHFSSSESTLGKIDPRLLNWIGSIDYSGFTRERCLRALIENFEPGNENRILLRLSDWVPNVQRLARDWILRNFASLPLQSIFANQRMILHLSRKVGLREDLGMVEIKRDLLARTKLMAPSDFFDFLPGFRRLLFQLSLLDDQHLRSWILDDPEPFNRLLLLSEFDLAEITFDEKVRLEADKSVFVRRRFLLAKLKAGDPLERAELIRLTLDSNRSLRQIGQFHLKRDYGEDARLTYLNLKGDEFYYIADFASPQDTEHFLSGISSGSRSTSYNCLRALASTAPELLKHLDMKELIARNRRFRQVLNPLLPQLLTVEEIRALRPVLEASSPLGTIGFLRLLERKSFWTFVDEGLAILLSNPGTALQQMIIGTIHSKVTIHEALLLERRESINNKILALREHDNSTYGRTADLLEFTVKNSRVSGCN